MAARPGQCSNCKGLRPLVADGECDRCRKYRDRNGRRRPVELEVKATERQATRRSLNDIDLEGGEFSPALLAQMVGARQEPMACSSGCGRLANPLDHEHRCKPCADLAWYHSQRRTAVASPESSLVELAPASRGEALRRSA